MKKIIYTLTLCLFISIPVFAGHQIDSKYYYDDEKKTIEYIDDKGEKVSKGPYILPKMLNGYIFAADEKGMRGLLDQDLNVVIPFEYRNIDYNKNTNTYKCIKDNVVEFYNSEFNKVPQPLDVRPLESTKYYSLIVVDESAKSLPISYICDENGNKLIEEPFKYLDGADGSIIAANENDMDGVYNSDLELAIPFEYTSISCKNGVFECFDYVSGKHEYISSKDFTPAEKINEIYNTAYFYKENSNGIRYICGFNGEVIKDKPYYEVNGIGYESEGIASGKLVVRSSDKYPRLYGLLDENLNEMTDEKYYRIYTDESGRIVCYEDGYEDIYDNNNNFIGKAESDLEFVKPIKGMEGKFVYNSNPDDHMPSEHVCVIDDKGNRLSDYYLSVMFESQPGNTLIAQKVVGHLDSSMGVLGPDMKPITPFEFGYMYVKEENGAIYIENEWSGSDTKYYDLYGNQYKTKAEALAAAKTKGEASAWAKETIEKAIEIGIIPEELQSQYIKKIKRDEFCQLAVNMYTAVTGMEYTTDKSYFRDTDAEYINAAYELHIVNGVGNDMFAPNKSITRQEAAVMLNNIAKLLNIEGTEKIDKFTDEGDFADWAKDAIYSVAAMKSEDTYVMAGTGEGKFSPYDFYTREQAIATMWRLYNCEEAQNTETATETASVEKASEETTNGFVTSYLKSHSVDKETESKIEQFIADNGDIIKDVKAIDYAGDDKFLVYWGGDFTLAEPYYCDQCALIDINGNFIIPKTDNLIINIGYGKFVQYNKDGDSYDRKSYKLYDIDGNVLDLEFMHMPINESMGLIDSYYNMIIDQTGNSDIIDILESESDLIPSDKNIYYNQYNWNTTDQQLCDFVEILCDKINIDYNSIEADIKEILSVNSEFDPFADTSVENARAVFNYLLKIKDKEDISEEVFVNKSSECYTFEDATLTAYNIYEKLVDAKQ